MMVARLLLFLASMLCYVAMSSARIWEIPIPDSLRDCYNRANSAKKDRYVSSVYSWICEHLLTSASYNTEPISNETLAYVDQLQNIALNSSVKTTPNWSKNQRENQCVRKEYRMLTFEERRRYHDAVNTLKRDKSVSPNKYDAIASINQGSTILIAHGGPGFLGWHRIYLLIYETALRQVDPRICLPYWDSTLDSKLEDPFMSSIWTPEFLGTPRGKVVDGAFANWELPNGGQLIRNVGIDGDVLTTDTINDILSRTSYDDIVSSNTVDPRFELELHHGGVQMFVGGAMTRLETAALDPVFFMHHAFVDYIFERFRSKLKSINRDPAIYPSTFNTMQLANASTGFSRLSLADGYSEDIAKRVTYEPVPTCSSNSPSCGERYVDQLQDIALKSPPETTPSRPKRQAESRCVRKEYRMLTLEERRRYHDAVNALKRDMSVSPNKYDVIANIHTNTSSRLVARGGPSFFGWNRMYLLIFETALREVDPRVCLPYWDSTLDSKLQDPFMSSLWTPEFLGTPRGSVSDGPFADWRLPNGGQLIRNVGIDGSVLTTDNINDVLSRTSYDEIVISDTADPRYLLEILQGAVHSFVGGHMSSMRTSAFDPVYFMHKAFVDYIWEMFRSKLKSINVDPAIYPSTNIPTQQGNVSTGFSDLRHSYGYSEDVANKVTYAPVPICSSTSRSCGKGSSLICRTSDWLCIPTTRTLSNSRPERETAIQDTCIKPRTYALPNQNDFCLGSTCDTDEWVMIPVKIISIRPPKFGKYNSYPVKRGRIDDTRDIYSTNGTDNLSTYIYSRQGNLKTYERCQEGFAVGQIFLYSHGINYSGYYKESTIVDQRLTVSVSLGFIGVKKPSEVEGGVSKALVRAHDSCGRVCQVTCRDAVSKNYTVCSGAVAVDDKEPRMHGRNSDEAVMTITDNSLNNEVPEFNVDNLYITFYCDYSGGFPFADRNN